ncbi:hypothetical protein HHI36_017001, partial [Cryptolaemus montrouzieri]
MAGSGVDIDVADDTLFGNTEHHNALTFQIDNINCVDENPNFEMEQYDFKKANYVGLNGYFSSVDWQYCGLQKTIDSKIARFYDVIFSGFELFVPRKVVKQSNYPVCFNRQLIALIQKKKKLSNDISLR